MLLSESTFIKRKDQRRKKKFSSQSKYHKTSEMDQQNKQYMYKLERSVHITDISKQSVLQAFMK